MANQGCHLFNVQQFQAMIAQFDSIDVSVGIPSIDVQAQVQALIDEAMNPILGVQAAINAQIALLAPLISIPTDLGSVISWLTTFIDTSFVIPHTNLIAQEAAMIAQIAALTASIASLEARLGISITIPTAPHC